jgi:hypothetical protein
MIPGGRLIANAQPSARTPSERGAVSTATTSYRTANPARCLIASKLGLQHDGGWEHERSCV